jgi:hypothetical protein
MDRIMACDSGLDEKSKSCVVASQPLSIFLFLF